MDVNKDIGIAAVFAQGVWVVSGLGLYLTVPGTALFSTSAAIFFLAGIFVGAPALGLAFYGLRRAATRVLPVPADAPMADAQEPNWTWLLTVVEAIVIFIVAGLSFEQIESMRAGVPVQYIAERNEFDTSLKAFSAANELEEEAKAARASGQADAEIEDRIVLFMEVGIMRSQGVSEPFLAYLHPELPQTYRTQLIRGYGLLIEGRRAGDLAKQTEGNELVRRFYDEFLPTRTDAILAKMGVQTQ